MAKSWPSALSSRHGPMSKRDKCHNLVAANRAPKVAANPAARRVCPAAIKVAPTRARAHRRDGPPRAGAAGAPPPPRSVPVNNAPPPPDIPDARDDDVVARQLREAAMTETDPDLKDALWEEYRRYKEGS